MNEWIHSLPYILQTSWREAPVLRTDNRDLPLSNITIASARSEQYVSSHTIFKVWHTVCPEVRVRLVQVNISALIGASQIRLSNCRQLTAARIKQGCGRRQRERRRLLQYPQAIESDSTIKLQVTLLQVQHISPTTTTGSAALPRNT